MEPAYGPAEMLSILGNSHRPKDRLPRASAGAANWNWRDKRVTVYQVNASVPSISQQISSVVERVYAPALAEVEAGFSNLRIVGNVQRFIISRMGSTGSTWFAKLLNGHPEVYCSHEGIMAQIYPSKGFDASDVTRFIKYFAWNAKHEAYRALGDVGSAFFCHLRWLPAFTTALLVRHPARILNTRLTVYPRDQSFSAVPAESHACIQELWGIDLQHYEPIDQIFLHDTWTFATQVWVLDKANLVIRIEDLQEVENCLSILHSLTGLEYSRTLVEEATLNRVNRRSHGDKSIAEIVAGFTPRQRDWYRLMLSDILPSFGYDLQDETPIAERNAAAKPEPKGTGSLTVAVR